MSGLISAQDGFSDNHLNISMLLLGKHINSLLLFFQYCFWVPRYKDSFVSVGR
jgi:hypothetical protein